MIGPTDKPQQIRAVHRRARPYTNYDWARDLARLNGTDAPETANRVELARGIAEMRKAIGPK